MRILLIITKSEIGGATVFVLNLARGLKKIGHDVEVAAGEGNFLFKELEKEKIIFHYLDKLKRDFSPLNTFGFIIDLYRILKKNNYDLVHLNSSNALVGALATIFIKNKPITSFTFHGLSFIDKNYQANSFFKLLARYYYKILLKKIDKVVFECNLNYLEVMNSKMVKKAIVIYNGTDHKNLSFLTSEEVREYFSRQFRIDLSESFIIGSTGRLIYQKNYEFLINNFRSIKLQIPNAKLLIIGEGPDHNRYRKLIKDLVLQDDVLLAGELNNSHKFIKGFDVFTLVSRYEGVAISLIESLFAEVPILVSDVGGNRDVIGEFDKGLFKLNNFREFLDKLVLIKSEKNIHIENCLKMQPHFTLDNMINEYNRLFVNSIKNKTRILYEKLLPK